MFSENMHKRLAVCDLFVMLCSGSKLSKRGPLSGFAGLSFFHKGNVMLMEAMPKSLPVLPVLY